MMAHGNDDFYEISAVSRLTGLSIHVLRIWERRHGVVEPDRTASKRRLYSRSDVKRLTLLKALVDEGQTISSIAKLSLEALEERLAEVASVKGSEGGERFREANCRVGFVGVLARKSVRDAAEFATNFTVVAEFPSLDELSSSLSPGAIDVLIVSIDCLFPEDVSAVRRALASLDIERAIVLYQFANSELIKAENHNGIRLLRAPVTAWEILLACGPELFGARPAVASVRAQPLNPTIAPIPARLFTAEQLLAASQSSKSVQCECPHHLANLIGGLVAFEEYSQRCESVNEADSQLHAFLRQETAKCRFQMEQALEKVLKAEGISV